MVKPRNTGSVTAQDLRSFFWQEGDLRYKLDALQRGMSDRISRLDPSIKKIVILSSRQIGKSFFSMVFSTQFLLQRAKTTARVIAPTRQKCQEIVEDNFNVVISDVPEGMVARSAAKYRWNFYNQSSLRLGALEKQYVDKNRGGNSSLILYEECGFVASDDFDYGVDSVIGPQLLRARDGREMFISSPSVDPNHSLHRIAEAAEKVGALFRFHVFQSPSVTDQKIAEAADRAGCILPLDFIAQVRAENLSADAVIALAADRQIYLSDDFLREYMAQIIRPHTLMVIPKFYDESIKTKYDQAEIPNRLISIDWGGTRDKTVALVMAHDPKLDQDIFIDELVFDENTPTAEIVKQLKPFRDLYDCETVVADVTGQLKIDLASRFDLRVRTPTKNNWMSSVTLMASRFATKKVVVDPRCKFFIQSIRGGLFNKTRTDFARTRELGHMDALAAAMYAMRSIDRTAIKIYTDTVSSDTIFMGDKKENPFKKMLGRRFDS